MGFMVEKTDEHLQKVAEYLRAFMGDESIRSVARRANVSHGLLSELLSAKSMPKASTLRKIGTVAGANEATLLQLAGYLESRPRALSDPQVIALAQRLEDFPDSLRDEAIRAVSATLDSFSKAVRNSRIDAAYRLMQSVRAREQLAGLERRPIPAHTEWHLQLGRDRAELDLVRRDEPEIYEAAKARFEVGADFELSSLESTLVPSESLHQRLGRVSRERETTEESDELVSSDEARDLRDLFQRPDELEVLLQQIKIVSPELYNRIRTRARDVTKRDRQTEAGH